MNVDATTLPGRANNINFICIDFAQSLLNNERISYASNRNQRANYYAECNDPAGYRTLVDTMNVARKVISL